MAAGDVNSPVFDFSSLDYSSMDADLVVFAQKTFPNELWTDFNSSDFAKYLVEEMAYATDLVTYNANACVLEAIPATLIREQNFRNIGKSLDYTMAGAAASSCSRMRVYGLLNNVEATYPLTLESRFRFSTGNSVIFQPAATYIFQWTDVALDPTEGYYVEVAVTQGEEHYQESVTGVGGSDGKPGQRYPLNGVPVLLDTLSISVGGVPYIRISNAVEAGPSDLAYLVETDEEQITYIIFGDNINGIIPPTGMAIVATYKAGGGADTNFPADTSLSLVGVSGSPFPSPLTGGSVGARFVLEATGGGPKESLVSAKRALPMSLKANDRAVTDDDYASFALQVNGVFKAKAVPGTPIGGATPVLLFIVPDGFGNPSSVLANLIQQRLRTVRMSGKRIVVRNPSYVNLIFEAQANIKAGVSKKATEQRLRDTLLWLFDPSSVDFGLTFPAQTLYERTAPSEVDGLSHVYYRKFTVEAHYGRHVNRPTTGTGSVIGIQVDWNLVRRREWFIKVLPPDPMNLVFCNRFSVRQRRLGVNALVLDNVVTDEDAAYVENELVGWNFHPRPEELDDAYIWPISGNTQQEITVAGTGLLIHTAPGDPYVVEKDEPTTNYGKILRAHVSDAVVASTMLHVDSALSWKVLDNVFIQDGDSIYRRAVASVIIEAQTMVDADMEDGDTSAFAAVNVATLAKELGTLLVPAHAGARYMRITYNGTDNPRASQACMTLGRKYVLHWWARSNGPGGGSPRTPAVYYNGTKIWEGTSIDTAWQEGTYTIDAAAATTLEFGAEGGGAGIFVDFDDWYVEEQHALVLDQAITLGSGATLDHVWQATDESVKFSVVNVGSSAFIVGDGLYVDTYDATGDVKLRAEDFPLISAGNITINPIGGV